jgi:tetratricopeptide (TPR) repeat protein
MTANRLSFDDDLAAFADGAIGGGLSPQVAALITQAGLLRHLPEQALPLLEQARAAAPRHPAPLIALYRFYFYGHQLAQARAVGEDALAIARTALGLNFGDEPPSDDQARYDAAVRFYLFTLKGLAYLNMRLGELDEARLMLAELRRLDPQDHVGGALLAHVLARREKGDDSETGTAYPVRGWSGTGPRA